MEIQIFSGDSNSINFDVGSSSESQFEPGLSKGDILKCISYFHAAFAVFKTQISDREIFDGRKNKTIIIDRSGTVERTAE